MRRRELLTGALAAAAGGCAAQQRSEASGLPFGALSNFDRGLSSIRDPFAQFVRRETGDRDAIIPPHESALLTSTLGSLFVAGSLHDLPFEARRHPDVQSRVQAIVPEGGRSLYGMTMHMQHLPPAERVLMQKHLDHDPELPLRTAEHLDRIAASANLGTRARLQLRGLATKTAWRMAHQPISLLLDETTERVEKAHRRAGEWAVAQRRSLVLAMASDEDWDEDSEYEDYDEVEDDVREPRPWRGRGIAIAGGVAGILGVIGGYASLFWAYTNSLSSGSNSSSGPVALGIVSGVTFVAGVITKITGLVMKRREDTEWLERNPRRQRR